MRRSLMRTSPTIVRVSLALMAACWATSASSARGQAPPTMSESLLRQWDLNHDGKVDASEAEVARKRMRRVREEALMQNGNDPVTGRPRPATTGGGTTAPGATAGPAAGAREDDGGLILVPGNGEQSPFGEARETAPIPPASRRERDPLPGTRAPATPTTIPSTTSPRMPSVAPPTPPTAASRGGAGLPPTASGGRERAGGDLSSRSRILPDGSPMPAMPPRSFGRSPSVPAQQSAPPRPGVIAGGVRPTTPSMRSAAAVPPQQSLNAGRLPAGIPQTRGMAPGGLRGGSTIPPTQPFGGGQGSSMRSYVPQQDLRSTRPPTSRPPASSPSSGGPRSTRVGPEDFFAR